MQLEHVPDGAALMRRQHPGDVRVQCAMVGVKAGCGTHHPVTLEGGGNVIAGVVERAQHRRRKRSTGGVLPDLLQHLGCLLMPGRVIDRSHLYAAARSSAFGIPLCPGEPLRGDSGRGVGKTGLLAPRSLMGYGVAHRAQRAEGHRIDASSRQPIIVRVHGSGPLSRRPHGVHQRRHQSSPVGHGGDAGPFPFGVRVITDRAEPVEGRRAADRRITQRRQAHPLGE